MDYNWSVGVIYWNTNYNSEVFFISQIEIDMCYFQSFSVKLQQILKSSILRF